MEQESCRLHGDWQCLNLPSHFFIFFYFLPPCCSRLKLEPQQQTRAFCPFPSPGAACLSASLPDSHGPMIDCSLSAFVPGNCFVLLTVCLCSSPDSRDSMPPFLTYLPNMFKTRLKWITVEYVEVEEGRGDTEMSCVFKQRRRRGQCICVTGLWENQMHALNFEGEIIPASVFLDRVCFLWGLMWALLENTFLEMVDFLEIEDKNWGFFCKWEDFGKGGRLEFGFVRLGFWCWSGIFYQLWCWCWINCSIEEKKNDTAGLWISLWRTRVSFTMTVISCPAGHDFFLSHYVTSCFILWPSLLLWFEIPMCCLCVFPAFVTVCLVLMCFTCAKFFLPLWGI